MLPVLVDRTNFFIFFATRNTVERLNLIRLNLNWNWNSDLNERYSFSGRNKSFHSAFLWEVQFCIIYFSIDVFRFKQFSIDLSNLIGI